MSARQSAENGAPLTDVPFIKAPMPDRRDFPRDTAENDAGPKRCPHCNHAAFRTMTDYLCVSGCGWHERYDEPIPTRVIPPGTPSIHICPECGEPVTRESGAPYWVEPETKQRHHDPCPIPPATTEGGDA